MDIISSHDNNLIKKVIKLQDKKFRDKTNEFIIEGYRNICDSLPFYDKATVLIRKSSVLSYSGFKDAIIVEDRIFDKIDTCSNSQGIIAVVCKKNKKMTFSSDFCLFLDRIRDPGNLGTIFRTALACGFKEIYLYSCVDTYNTKVIRSSMSAIARLDIFDTDYEILPILKNKGYCILSADMNGENIFKTSIDGKVCLVIGNEANGISKDVISMSDKIISLPMESIESLNASVCASVMMYNLKYNK